MRRPRAIVAGALVALLVAACAAVLAPAAGAAAGGAISRRSGDVKATVLWRSAKVGIRAPRLFITRAGHRYRPRVRDICETGCVIAGGRRSGSAQGPLKVVDIDGDHDPEVLLDTYSGGAHCCVTLRVLSFVGGDYVARDIFWGDVGYRIANLDGGGMKEIVGRDPRFSEAFSPFAFSAFPPQVFHVTGGQLQNVTKAYPALLRRDASVKLHALRRRSPKSDLRGVLAAYVADRYRLGQPLNALAELARQRKRKAYGVNLAYTHRLLRRLRIWGYRR